MIFDEIGIELDDPCEAKEISRVKLTIFEDDDRGNVVHKHSKKTYNQNVCEYS